MLTLLKDRVEGRIVVNTVLLSSMNKAVVSMTKLGIFKEAGPGADRPVEGTGWHIMFRPIDPVFVIVGEVK